MTDAPPLGACASVTQLAPLTAVPVPVDVHGSVLFAVVVTVRRSTDELPPGGVRVTDAVSTVVLVAVAVPVAVWV